MAKKPAPRSRKTRAKPEDRFKQRIPISTAVRIRCDNWEHFRTEYAENISEGGIFIQTREPLSPGTPFHLEMSVGGEKILAKALVIWTKEFSTRETRRSGMGARFVDLNEAGRGLIRRWIETAIAMASG
ncbi:MAG: TIGR02266 family protein [Pseudomonadota bacterium]